MSSRNSRRRRCILREDRIYCGDKRSLPEDYSKFGSRFQCLRKGFGAGKFTEQKKWLQKYPPIEPRSIYHKPSEISYDDPSDCDEDGWYIGRGSRRVRPTARYRQRRSRSRPPSRSRVPQRRNRKVIMSKKTKSRSKSRGRSRSRSEKKYN